jgi:NAD(P)H-dependent flavin oxidoreductase YrpB (nitropropane dioxygenase family)
MYTALAQELGLEFPIFAFTHCRDVAASVSKAGGMGVFGVSSQTEAGIRAELEWIENEIGDKPYGVDLLLPQKFAGSENGPGGGTERTGEIPEEHIQFLDDLLEKYGVPALPPDTTFEKPIPLGYDGKEGLIELLFEHRISLIASALGPPPQWMVDKGRERGVKVAALAGTVEHARRSVEAGADLIIAQGYEAGGHTGTISTMVLVPEVVDAVAPVPVLAAGGIGNGRQLTASLALGAQGVWCGSVWLTTEEAETHPVVKEKFLEAGSGDTIRSRSLTGKPSRQLRSAWSEAWEDPNTPDPLPMPLQGRLIRDARARIERVAHNNEGARQLSNYWVGQIVGSMNQVQSVRSVMQEFAEEYAETMERLDDYAAGAS